MTACYTDRALKDFLNDLLPQDDIPALAAHIAECAGCQTRLNELTADPELDSFRESLIVAGAVCAEETLPDTVLQELRQLPVYRVPDLPNKERSQSKHRSRSAQTQTVPVRSLGGYRLLHPLGGNKTQNVFAAMSDQLDMEVVVKQYDTFRSGDRADGPGSDHDLETIANLDHPHLVRMIDTGMQSDRPYVVMERIHGCDLGLAVTLFGPLSIPDACEAIRQAALALEYLHEHGIVHRNVKPTSLLVSRDGILKLGDLCHGCFEPLEHTRQTETFSDHVIGDVDFIAPETIDDDVVDTRADLYSLGCVLFYLLTARHVFGGAEHGTMLKKISGHLYEEPVEISTLRSDVPAEIQELLRLLLKKCPEDRIQTPRELIERLQPYCERAALAKLAAQAYVLNNEEVSPAPEPAAAPTTIESRANETVVIESSLLEDSSAQPHSYGIALAGVVLATSALAAAAWLVSRN